LRDCECDGDCRGPGENVGGRHALDGPYSGVTVAPREPTEAVKGGDPGEKDLCA
jgi:hypothetical protein